MPPADDFTVRWKVRSHLAEINIVYFIETDDPEPLLHSVCKCCLDSAFFSFKKKKNEKTSLKSTKRYGHIRQTKMRPKLHQGNPTKQQNDAKFYWLRRYRVLGSALKSSMGYKVLGELLCTLAASCLWTCCFV